MSVLAVFMYWVPSPLSIQLLVHSRRRHGVDFDQIVSSTLGYSPCCVRFQNNRVGSGESKSEPPTLFRCPKQSCSVTLTVIDVYLHEPGCCHCCLFHQWTVTCPRLLSLLPCIIGRSLDRGCSHCCLVSLDVLLTEVALTVALYRWTFS